MTQDYYGILGVPKNASQDQIKNAYRELALKYHPDRNKSKDAEAKFKEINAAYAVLGNPEKRKQYDAFGPEGFNRRFTEEDIFRGFNFDDIFRNLQEMGFGGGPFGAGFGQEQQEQAGVNLYISFDDINRGFDKEFQVEHYGKCGNCNGTGGEPGSKQVRCAACNGKGTVHSQQRTPFGVFSFSSTCNACGGRGRTYEKVCHVCRGTGRVTVKERFRVKADKVGKESKDNARKFGIF